MKSRLPVILIIMTVSLLLLTGCANDALSVLPDKVPAYSPAQLAPAVAAKPTEGSLFRESSTVNYYRDLRAFRVGDIVTISIAESAQASKQATTNLGDDYSMSAGVTSLLGYETLIPHRAAGFDPSEALDAKTATTFKGSGTTTRKETMTAQMSARVIQVLMNGDLMIRGTREIVVNQEKQYIVLEGIVRPSDISSDNSISSSYIADARIWYTGKGVVSTKQQPGWMARILDQIWPF